MKEKERLTKSVIESVHCILKSVYGDKIEFIPHNIVPDQTLLKQGNKVYYSPRIQSGEVKVVELPDPDLEMKPPKLIIDYFIKNEKIK